MKTVTIEISDERAAQVLAAYGSKEAVLDEIRNTLSAKVQQHQQRVEDAKIVVVTNKGNLVLGASAASSSAENVLALSNSAVAPGSSTDLVQLYAVDLSAGNATLGIFTETAVAADPALVSTSSLTVKINGTNSKLMLS